LGTEVVLPKPFWKAKLDFQKKNLYYESGGSSWQFVKEYKVSSLCRLHIYACPSPRVVPRRGRQQRQHTTTDRCGGDLPWHRPAWSGARRDREGSKKSRRRGGSSATLHRPGFHAYPCRVGCCCVACDVPPLAPSRAIHRPDGTDAEQ
jgi:hypothetical protein